MNDEELKRLLQANAAETRRQFEATAERLTAENRHFFQISTEELKHEIGLIAENVTRVEEKLDREAADIRQEMRKGFAETQAMIKFSHAELDRRVHSLEENLRSLEDTVSDLQARVERLETSTH